MYANFLTRATLCLKKITCFGCILLAKSKNRKHNKLFTAVLQFSKQAKKKLRNNKQDKQKLQNINYGGRTRTNYTAEACSNGEGGKAHKSATAWPKQSHHGGEI